MEIVDLEPNDPRLDAVLPVLRELRPHLTPEGFQEICREGYQQGLRFTAALGDDGSCQGVAGWRVIVNTSSLRKLYVDDLVTSTSMRSTGVGRGLLAYLEQRARELGCRELSLDSGSQRYDAHRFYMREGMAIVAFHFRKLLTTD